MFPTYFPSHLVESSSNLALFQNASVCSSLFTAVASSFQSYLLVFTRAYPHRASLPRTRASPLCLSSSLDRMFFVSNLCWRAVPVISFLHVPRIPVLRQRFSAYSCLFCPLSSSSPACPSISGVSVCGPSWSPVPLGGPSLYLFLGATNVLVSFESTKMLVS